MPSSRPWKTPVAKTRPRRGAHQSQVNLFHRATRRIERSLDENEQAQRRLQREQDGSEVKSTRLERLTAEGLTLIGDASCMDMMRDHAAAEFVHHHGIDLAARTGSMATAQHMTAALIDSRDFLAAGMRDQVMLPAGPAGRPHRRDRLQRSPPDLGQEARSGRTVST